MTYVKLGTIEEEAAACRAAFAAVQVGDWALFCHHNIIVEQLREPPENRISYILSEKPKNEQAARLHWFRPLPQTTADDYRANLKVLEDDYRKKLEPIEDGYRAELKRLYNYYRAKLKVIDDDYRADLKTIEVGYWAKLKVIDDDYRAKCKVFDDDLIARYLPGCPWDGTTLFPKEE